MILSRLLPAEGGPERIDLDDAGADRRLAELYAPSRSEWLRLNMVASVTGSAAGDDGTSNSLTNPVDRRLLRVIRDLADVVLVGAQSVRAEGYRVPRTSRLAVVTGTGDLTGSRLSGSDPDRLMVLCPATSVAAVTRSLAGAAAEIVVVGDDGGRMPPARIIAALRERGLGSIVCEGGPRLSAQLLADDLVDELCLSTAPFATATTLPLVGGIDLPQRRLRLSQLLSDESSAVYARWAVARE